MEEIKKNIAKIKYEMVEFEIRVGAMVNKKFVENGLKLVEKIKIKLKFSNEEAKNFIDNVIVVNDLNDNKLKILPLKFKKNEEDIYNYAIKDDIEKLERVVNILYNNIEVKFYYDSVRKELFYKYSDYSATYDFRNISGKHYTINFENFIYDAEKAINEKMFELGRMLSEDEIKKIVYEYLCSYNLRKDIEEMINKLSLLMIGNEK